MIDLTGERNATIQPIEIAGTYTTSGSVNRRLDERFELLRDSKSNSDADREGFRAQLHGGRFPFDDKHEGKEQRAIIEFVCDRNRTGTEGTEKDEGDKEAGDGKDGKKNGEKDGGKGDEKKGEKKSERRDDEKKDDKSLRFISYKSEDADKDKKAMTLRLEWRTKHACEQRDEDSVSSHWGFFTWSFIM